MISLTPLLLLLCFFLTYSSSSSPVSITITPKILSKSGDSVHVEWSGIESPSKLDWLGIYSPSNSSDDNFIGYVLLSTCKNWQSGSCSIDLPLVNLRSSYEFRIFHWSSNEKMRNWSITHDTGDDNPLLPGITYQMAKSEELRFQTGRGPEQIHLAFTMNDDEMRVMFVTEDGKENYVKYGEEEVEMDEVAETGVRRYEQLDMCDSPANESIGWRDPGFIHDGVMKNLKRGKRYYYNVGSSAGGWSETHSFVSRDQDSNETLAFLFGDMGTATPYSTFRRTQEESKSTVKWITRDIKALDDKPTFISHIGDISYARGYSWLWDTFFTQIEPIASKVPYHVCIGNHEYDWPLQPWKPDWAQKIYNKDGGGECGVPYSLRFNMPSNCSVPTGTHSPATQNLYYSFHVGVVHFLYMSTETNFLPGSDQYNFIKQDLEGIDRKKTPFVVVQGHRPMYTSSSNSKDGPLRERMIKHLEPLFVKNKVTLALWGHVHRYERFCPMKNFTCGGRGTNGGEGEDLPVHVVIGMGGQDWQPIWAPLSDEPKHPIFPQPHQSLFRASEFGYTRLVATKEKLTLTYIGNHDGKPHDMVEIPASDPVLYSGFDSKKQESPGLNGGNSDVRGGSMVTESESPWYVKLGVIILVGAFLGFVHGLVSDFTKKATSRTSWILMESEEV